MHRCNSIWNLDLLVGFQIVWWMSIYRNFTYHPEIAVFSRRAFNSKQQCRETSTNILKVWNGSWYIQLKASYTLIVVIEYLNQPWCSKWGCTLWKCWKNNTVHTSLYIVYMWVSIASQVGLHTCHWCMVKCSGKLNNKVVIGMLAWFLLWEKWRKWCPDDGTIFSLSVL